MSLRAQFSEDTKTAMKAKDAETLSTLRLISAALKDRDINARGAGNPDGIAEQEILSMLQTMIKQRQESEATYRGAGRADLADKEAAEIAVIRRYLPTQMEEPEMQAAIATVASEMGVSDIRDMGKLMAEVKARYAGRMDMAKASGLVKAHLSGK